MKIFESLLNVWKAAKKPSKEEIKTVLYATLLLAIFIGLIGFIIFVSIQYSIFLFKCG